MYKKTIGVSLGCTLKLFPEDPRCYEFIRLDVSYSEEMKPSTVPIKDKYSKAWEIVEEELMDAAKEMKKNLIKLRSEEEDSINIEDN